MKIFLLTISKAVFLLWIRFVIYVSCLSCLKTLLSVLCSLVVTFWERGCLLALLCVMFSYVFVTFPCDVLGQVWYLIVSISDLCLLSYSVMPNNLPLTLYYFDRLFFRVISQSGHIISPSSGCKNF